MSQKLSYTFNRIVTTTNFFVSKRKGSIFKMTSPSGKMTYFDERVLNLRIKEKSAAVSILKSDWKFKLPYDLYVALVIIIKGKEPFIYLIPTKVFEKPNHYIFFNNQLPERLEHLSNWQIKVFGKGIEKLSEYAFDNVIKTLE